MKKNLYILSISDLVYSVFFYFFILAMMSITKSKLKRFNASKKSIEDRTLKFSKFSRCYTDEEEFKAFFSELGEVSEVKLARDFSGTLLLFVKEAEIMRNLEFERKRCEYYPSRSEKEMQKLTKKLDDFKKISRKKILSKNLKIQRANEYPPLFGYVVFSSYSEKKKVESIYSHPFLMQKN